MRNTVLEAARGGDTYPWGAYGDCGAISVFGPRYVSVVRRRGPALAGTWFEVEVGSNRRPRPGWFPRLAVLRFRSLSTALDVAESFNLVEFLAGSPPDDDDDVCGRPGGAFEFLDRGDLREPCDFPAGRVVGVARLAAWAEEDGRRSPGLDSRGALGIAMSPWFSGPIGIHLAAAVALPEPVPLRGFRGWPRIRDRRIRADLDALVDPCPFCDRVRGHADECIARDVLSSGGRDELRFEVRGREVTITVRSAESELHFAVPRGVDRLGLRRAWLACLDGVV